MAKFIRIEMPIDKSEETVKLGEDIGEKHTALGVGSPLTGFVDMAAFAAAIADAKTKLKDAKDAQEDKETLYGQAKTKCGLGEGQNKDDKDTLYWFVVQTRDLLLTLNRGNEENLSPYGFNVVISEGGGRKFVRVDIPRTPEEMVKLSEDINEHHTALGVGSPLTAALIDMTAFDTLTTEARTLLDDWETKAEDSQTLHGQAMTILGYAEGQTSHTLGTVYYSQCIIRDRLLQANQGDERNLKQWGFTVIVTESGTGKKKLNKGLKGKVTDAATGNPIAGALVHVVQTDTLTTTDDNGNYHFQNLAAGTYTIQSAKSGYLDFEIPEIVVTENAATTLNIELAAGVLIEGTVGAAATVQPDTTGITFSPTTILQLLAQGSTLKFTFSANPGDAFVAPWAENNDGQSSTVTSGDIGFGPLRMVMQVYNAGITQGTYRIVVHL